MIRRPPRSTRTYTLFPYTTLFRSLLGVLLWRVASARLSLAGGSLASWAPNFSPVASLILCLGLFLPSRAFALAAAVAIVLLSEIALGLFADGGALFSLHSLNSATGLAAVLLVGLAFRGRRMSLPRLALLLALCSTLFHLLTNTWCWVAGPLYPKTPAGWLQSQVFGLPGYPPSILFLRNTIISDQLFGALFHALVVLPGAATGRRLGAAGDRAAEGRLQRGSFHDG